MPVRAVFLAILVFWLGEVSISSEVRVATNSPDAHQQPSDPTGYGRLRVSAEGRYSPLSQERSPSSPGVVAEPNLQEPQTPYSRNRMLRVFLVGQGERAPDANEFSKLRLSAGQGDPNAQYRLGCCYCLNTDDSAGAEQMVGWFRRAAENRESRAQFMLGLCYAQGNVVPQDLPEAITWYRKAAEQGHTHAQAILGWRYALGDGVQKDWAEATRWFTAAAQGGNADAQLNLGVCYDKGRGIEKDPRQAVSWYRKAAEQGNADAQHNLGVCYYQGNGVQQDAGEACRWFRKAAEQGHASAQYNLAVCYHTGDGVAKDRREAVKWYRRIAEKGHPAAQCNLGVCYHEGEGVEKDAKEAFAWYCRAADQGNELAQAKLATCYLLGFGARRDYVQAYKWACLAAIKKDKQNIALEEAIRPSLSPLQISEAQRGVRVFVAKMEGEVDDNLMGVVRDEDPSVRSRGTGFFVTADGLIVTAQHVVAGARSIKAGNAGRLLPARLVFQDEAADLAVLKIETSNEAAMKVVPSLRVRAHDSVVTVGFPKDEPRYSEGTISSLTGLGDNPRYFQVSLPIRRGNSGGPMVDARGNVVGMLNPHFTELDLLANSGVPVQNVYAVKSSFIIPFLEGLPSYAKVQDSGESPTATTRSAMIEKVRQAVVLVLCY